MVTAFYFVMTNVIGKTTCTLCKNIFETFPHLTNVLKKVVVFCWLSLHLFEMMIGKLSRKAGMNLAEPSRAAALP